MPVFDFNHTPEKETVPECTYTTFLSSQSEASPEMPILILGQSQKTVEASFLRSIYQSDSSHFI